MSLSSGLFVFFCHGNLRQGCDYARLCTDAVPWRITISLHPAFATSVASHELALRKPANHSFHFPALHENDDDD